MLFAGTRRNTRWCQGCQVSVRLAPLTPPDTKRTASGTSSVSRPRTRLAPQRAGDLPVIFRNRLPVSPTRAGGGAGVPAGAGAEDGLELPGRPVDGEVAVGEARVGVRGPG